jgi:hypothetical protein
MAFSAEFDANIIAAIKVLREHEATEGTHGANIAINGLRSDNFNTPVCSTITMTNPADLPSYEEICRELKSMRLQLTLLQANYRELVERIEGLEPVCAHGRQEPCAMCERDQEMRWAEHVKSIEAKYSSLYDKHYKP